MSILSALVKTKPKPPPPVVSDRARCFFVQDGAVLCSLSDLDAALPGMKDDAFRHHVTGEKNDFAAWVRDVLGERPLAHELRSGSRDKHVMHQVVSDYLRRHYRA